MKRPYETKEGVCGGVPILGGVRLPAFYLVDYIDDDTSLDQFFEDYELDPGYVEAFLLHPLHPSLRKKYAERRSGTLV